MFRVKKMKLGKHVKIFGTTAPEIARKLAGIFSKTQSNGSPNQLLTSDTLSPYLREEARINRNESSNNVETCGDNFSQSCNLNQHMKNPEGNWNFKCKICEKKYSGKYSLRKHVMRLHSTDKPFCCEICEKSFSTKGDLRQHMRMHTGERPYGCEICGN